MKYTFRKKIQISADAVVSVDANSPEEALKRVNETGVILMDMADASIGIHNTDDYHSELEWMGDEYEDFTLEELDQGD